MYTRVFKIFWCLKLSNLTTYHPRAAFLLTLPPLHKSGILIL